MSSATKSMESLFIEACWLAERDLNEKNAKEYLTPGSYEAILQACIFHHLRNNLKTEKLDEQLVTVEHILRMRMHNANKSQSKKHERGRNPHPGRLDIAVLPTGLPGSPLSLAAELKVMKQGKGKLDAIQHDLFRLHHMRFACDHPQNAVIATTQASQSCFFVLTGACEEMKSIKFPGINPRGRKFLVKQTGEKELTLTLQSQAISVKKRDASFLERHQAIWVTKSLRVELLLDTTDVESHIAMKVWKILKPETSNSYQTTEINDAHELSAGLLKVIFEASDSDCDEDSNDSIDSEIISDAKLAQELQMDEYDLRGQPHSTNDPSVQLPYPLDDRQDSCWD